MHIDWSIVQATLIFTGITFLLGAPLKWKLPQIPYYCLPAIGLIVFGGVAVPILYLLGHFNVSVLFGVTAFLAGLGVVSLIFTVKNSWPLKRPSLFSLIAVSLFILLALGFFVQASKYPVPGGIDPAIHAAYINHIVLFENFNITYPLGMHLFVLLIERISLIFTPAIFLGLQIFFILNISVIAYYIIRRISGNTIAGIMGSLAVIIDVSIYNNYLNGSMSHLLAILLIALGIALALTVRENNKSAYFLTLTVFYIAVFYFHFISLFILLPALWFLRIYQTDRSHWLPILVFPLSVLVAIPVLGKIAGVPGFKLQIIAACLFCLSMDVVIYFFSKKIKSILSAGWGLLLFGVIGLLAFYHLYIVTGVMQPWYGLFILVFAAIGALFILLKKMSDWYPFLIYASSLAIFDYLITLLPDKVNVGIFRQMIYYYGFTIPLVLLSSAFLYSIVKLSSRRMIRTGIFTVLLVLVMLITSSRFFDKSFLTPTGAISRYGSNDGYGMFYTLDDVRVANWARTHLPKDAGIVNPGGLYSSWASITQRKIMYLAFAVINSVEPEKAHQEVINLLNNQDLNCPQQLFREKYQYLLLPSLYGANLENRCVSLLYSSGNTRLYKINDRPTSSAEVQTINFYDLAQNKDITVEGNYTMVSNYTGNRFYYQFIAAVQQLRIPVQGVIIVTIAAPDHDRNINLIVVGQSSLLTARIIDRDEGSLKFSEKYVLQNYLQHSGEPIRVGLQNRSHSNADIQMIRFEALE